MPWDPTRLFQAIGAHGMLATATWRPAADAVSFACGFEQPDVLVLGDQHQTTGYSIEYESSAVPPMNEGDPVTVTYRGQTHSYTVRNEPNAQRDGFYTKAELTRTA